jgi:alcohol dehydrogenase (NADP+)
MTDSSEIRMRKLPLNNESGYIPALGFGTLIPDPAVTVTATRDALEAGFRHFDCAERYRNWSQRPRLWRRQAAAASFG